MIDKPKDSTKYIQKKPLADAAHSLEIMQIILILTDTRFNLCHTPSSIILTNRQGCVQSIGGVSPTFRKYSFDTFFKKLSGQVSKNDFLKTI